MTHKIIKSLDDLFLEELGDLYSAENQLVKAVPKLAQATNSSELQSALEDHLQETKHHVDRLEEAFKDLGQKPGGVVCKAMKGLIAEGEEVVRKSEKSPARDAAIIAAAQRVEHYEIAGYGTAQSHASLLGHTKIQKLLQETLDEEKTSDHRLNELAQGTINPQAMASSHVG